MRKLRRTNQLVIVAAIGLSTAAAGADVVINVPPPKPAQTTQQDQPQAGDLALQRYVNARVVPYSTSGPAPGYSAYRNYYGYYGYPYFGYGWGVPIFVSPVFHHGHRGHHGHHGGHRSGMSLAAPGFGMSIVAK